MDKFISAYEKKRNENLGKSQEDYRNEVADNIYNYVNNNKDNLPKDLQEQLKGFEIGGDNKLKINENIDSKNVTGEVSNIGVKAGNPLLGGSKGKEDNKQDNKQDNIQEQKKKAEETKEKLEKFNETKEDKNKKPNN